jgi:hypothetical protein
MFLSSPVRAQLDAEYRFPTAITRQLAGANSQQDEKLRQFNTQLESLEAKVFDWQLNENDLTKFDDEVQMGFDVQLLTADLLEQHVHLDPTKRSMKVSDRYNQIIACFLSCLSSSWSIVRRFRICSSAIAC